MVHLKKVAIAILTLSSSIALAGTMGPACTQEGVALPCDSSGWNVSIEALYLKNMYNANFLSGINIGSGSGVRIIAPMAYDFEWGFLLGIGYQYGAGSDINVNWMEWHDPNQIRLAPPVGTLATSPGSTLANLFYETSKIDVVNLELGQKIELGQVKDIRLHGGLQFANIRSTPMSTSTITGGVGPDAPFNGTSSYTEKYSMRGVGPRVGADLSYNIYSPFALYANAATALLVGKTKYADDASYTDTSRPVRSNFQTIVPEFEGDVGAKYTYGLAQGSVIIDVGYKVINYLEPLHDTNFDLTTFTTTRNQINYGLQGPHAGLKWVG